jgi:CheY-like chemotaxis protein
MTIDTAMNILVVEDDQTSSLALCRLLEKKGHTARRAFNGVEAVNLVASENFDLVLMDIHMPEMDGLEATRRIRRGEEPNSSVPIIAVSAIPTPPGGDQCLDVGMNGFIPKPFSFSSLEHALWRIRKRDPLS